MMGVPKQIHPIPRWPRPLAKQEKQTKKRLSTSEEGKVALGNKGETDGQAHRQSMGHARVGGEPPQGIRERAQGQEPPSRRMEGGRGPRLVHTPDPRDAGEQDIPYIRIPHVRGSREGQDPHRGRPAILPGQDSPLGADPGPARHDHGEPDPPDVRRAPRERGAPGAGRGQEGAPGPERPVLSEARRQAVLPEHRQGGHVPQARAQGQGQGRPRAVQDHNRRVPRPGAPDRQLHQPVLRQLLPQRAGPPHEGAVPLQVVLPLHGRHRHHRMVQALAPESPQEDPRHHRPVGPGGQGQLVHPPDRRRHRLRRLRRPEDPGGERLRQAEEAHQAPHAEGLQEDPRAPGCGGGANRPRQGRPGIVPRMPEVVQRPPPRDENGLSAHGHRGHIEETRTWRR